MAFLIRDQSGSASDISSEKEMDSFSPAIDGEYDLQLRLTGLNGAAATLTMTVNLNDGVSDYNVAYWSEAKKAAADTNFATQVNGVTAKSTDTLSWKALSSNSGDTSVTPRSLMSFSNDFQAIAGDTASASDLKDFADAGYDPVANKVNGVKLVDALTGGGGTPASDIWTYANRGLTARSDYRLSDTYKDEIASDVWVQTVRTITSGGGTPASDVWRFANRSLTALSDISQDILKVSASDVDGSAGTNSLYSVIQAILESQISGSDFIIYQTDGTTVHVTKQATSDRTANPITRVQ